MARKCALTGKKTMFGNSISHSEIKNKRKWKVNLHTKKLYLEDEDRWVKAKVSTKALKTITRKMTFSDYCRKHGINTSKLQSVKP
jgi:large subunit ribosomal protein L28